MERTLKAALVAVALAGCTQSFSPWGDEATLVLSWTVDGVPADGASCEAAGAARVRMAINREPVDWFDDRLEWSCADGGAYLESMFRTGSFYMRWDLLDAAGEVVSSTGWVSLQLGEEPRTIDDIDFATD
jgi:hypothetical protein